MVVEESIQIRGSIEQVWGTFTDLTCWVDWNTVLKGVASSQTEVMSEGNRFKCCMRPFAFPIYFEPTIEGIDPYKRIVWTGSKYGIRAVHEWFFRQHEKGVEVVSKETFTGLPILAFRLFSKTTIRKMTRAMLDDLRRAAES
jgi:hypothetical protein